MKNKIEDRLYTEPRRVCRKIEAKIILRKKGKWRKDATKDEND